MKIQTIGDEFEEIFVKPTISEKKIVTLSKLSAMTCSSEKINKVRNDKLKSR
jgi:hypothetical protein